MATYTQENRRIQVITPLGDDVLLLQSFSGHEGVSTLFQFDLAMHSENREIKFDDIIGKKATIRIIDDVGKERYVNGIISSFAQSGASSIFAYYRATLVPWTWLLTRTTDCRIFQNKTVPDIIEKIFDERGFKDYKNELSGSFTEREYCVQYRETSFNFVSRLMQEEGIFYYFRHEEDTHTLVLANNPSAFKPCPNQAEARYEPVEGAGYTEDVVTQWSIGQEVRPGKYSIVDFDFEKPLLDLTAGVDGADARKYEIYDYPGEYKTKSEGEGLVGIRMQEEEATRILASGSSTCRFFTTGYKFDFKDHYRKDLNKTYVLTSVYHTADAGSNYEPDAGDALEYTNQFQCIPHPTPFRPPRTAPVPVVHGTQTAIVVGPSGEEIYVDKYGRVKVQFHWDREGKYDEKSSCWVRVSQNWAGKRWGAMFIPRIGQEVIVDFIEGDPDRPIITGRVYNGASMPPYALPDEMTKSAIKTNSSKGGAGFNELRFEDKKGKEQIFIHAERNKDIRVKNDLLEWVGNDSHRIIKKKHYEKVEEKKHLIVVQDQIEKVEGDEHLIVVGDRLEKIDGKRHLKVGGNKHEKVGGNKNVDVASNLNEKVGQKVSMDAGMDIHQKAGMNYAVDAGMAVHIKAGMTCVIEAGLQLTIKAGASFIDIGPAGISIVGTPLVNINSGGAAGSGGGCSPTAPEPPEDPEVAEEALVADTAEPGEAVEMPPPKAPAKPTTYSPGALVLKQAAENGTPFCDI